MANSFTLAVPKDVLDADTAKAHINAESGTLPEVDGVQLSYVVSASTKSLYAIEFTIIKKPFYVTVDTIKAHIRGLLGQ